MKLKLNKYVVCWMNYKKIQIEGELSFVDPVIGTQNMKGKNTEREFLTTGVRAQGSKDRHHMRCVSRPDQPHVTRTP